MNKMLDYVKIGGILLSAFLISNLVLNIAYTGTNPSKIRPNLGSYLLAQVKKVMHPGEFISSLFPKVDNESRAYAEQKIKDGYNTLQRVAFTQLAPGVNVRAADNVSETSYNLDGVKWVKQKVVVNGVERTFGWPEGKPLPPQEVLEGMFR